MACERIKKLLDNNKGSSKSEDDKSESTTQMPPSSTAASSTSTSLNDFQKKISSSYESRINKNCSFKRLPELNPNIEKLDEDILYHIALGNKSHDLQKMFKDVKFVVMGGTPKRMEQFAYYIMNEIGYELPPGTLLNDISKHSHRYAMYKVGPVMSVSHGMGMPSIGILLHELIKLVHHAGMVDPIFVRIGTCGGFSRKGGTVVVSDEVVNDYLESVYELSILGTNVRFPAVLDQSLASELAALADPQDNFETIKGKTNCTDSFYDGSGRADGAICEFSNAQGMEYYKTLQKNGVVNVEMESLAFAALTCRAGIRSAVTAVILSDRLETDQIKQPKEVLDEWKKRPQKLLARYIKKVLAESGTSFAKMSTSDESAMSQGTHRPTLTVSTPGVTPSGKIICPPLSCGRKQSGVASTTSQPSAATSTQPATGRPATSSSCKPVCQKMSIPGLGTETTGVSTKPTSATDLAKTTMAAAKKDSQPGWRSCYKACGIGSEQVDAGTPQASQQYTTVKPTISAGLQTSAAMPKGFDCACDSGKIAEPGKTPMTKPATDCNIKSSSGAPKSGSTIASTTSGSTTSGPSYKAKDFDSSTKSTDSNESRNAYYKHCVKLPRCDQPAGAQKQHGTFETPTQEKTKGTAQTNVGETRPCCIHRSADTRSPRTQVAEQQKYIEDRLDQELQATPSKPSGGSIRRVSMPQPVANLELGPCCTGTVTKKTPKDVGEKLLGPCCTGQKDEDRSPECSDAVSPNSETFESTTSDKSEESPPVHSTAPTAASTKDKGRVVPSDCPFVLTKKCGLSEYAKKDFRASAAEKQVVPSPETPDPRQGIKGPIFSTTPMPGSKSDLGTLQDQTTTVPASVTPTVGSRGSCCLKSISKNGGPAAALSSTTARQSGGSCCHQFSSTRGSAAGTSKPTDSTNGQIKSAAPTSKSEPEKITEDRRETKQRTSKVQSINSLELGPCCTEKDKPVESKTVGVPELGPCCLGQKDKESPPECADARLSNSETFQSTTQDKSAGTPLPQSAGTTTIPSADKDKKMSTDCAKLLKSKCNYQNSQKVSATDKRSDQMAEDSRQSTKAAEFSTPMPGFKAAPDTPQDQSTPAPAFITPGAGARGSCCVKSAPQKGGVAETWSSTKARKSAGPCCNQFSSSGVASANGPSKPADSTNSQSKSAAPSSKSGTEVNKYDESPSPCAACKKYQDSKIIFTGGTPSVSQPEIIKCPHKLKRLKDECQGYD